MSGRPSHLDQQREFYETREHAHLRPRARDHYSEKLVARLVDALGIRPHHRVVEIGASFGRFTMPLLRHCESVVAVDLSERALEALVAARDASGIGEDRCRPLVADARELTPESIGEPADFVIGFFILHHLDDVAGTVDALARLLRTTGGGMGFLEPNRRNPLFLAQVVACQDMTWREERGMFLLSARGVRRALSDAGLSVQPVVRFGFFPPQIVNRFDWARRVEEGIERAGLLDPLLPFLLVTAHVDHEGAAPPAEA